MSTLPTEYLAIDEHGRFLKGEDIVQDPTLCQHFLKELYFAENGAFATRSPIGEEFLVEAFDEPLIAEEISLEGGKINVGYSVVLDYSLSHFTVDEWDRFHGRTKNGIPFVLSPEAQDQFFSSVDSYDDEGFSFKGKYYPTPSWLNPKTPVETEKYWTERYQKSDTGWDLAAPSPAFEDIVPRLKIPRSRVMVLGCGAGHDAAYFAKLGHIVTAVDFSPSAIDKAKSLYRDLNIKWHQGDAFVLPGDWAGQFDLVVEHTCYCAVDPRKRNALTKVWLQLLQPQGQLLGVFFSMDKPEGPPFGGSEWEIRQRLKKNFQFLFWGRWQKSLQGRDGKELLVFAQKKT